MEVISPNIKKSSEAGNGKSDQKGSRAGNVLARIAWLGVFLQGIRKYHVLVATSTVINWTSKYLDWAIDLEGLSLDNGAIYSIQQKFQDDEVIQHTRGSRLR